MYYINQIGHCELGRGLTFKEAFADAKCQYPDLFEHEVALYRHGDRRNHNTGDVMWTDEYNAEYNA